MNTPQFVRYEGGFDFDAGLEDAKKNPAYWQEDLLIKVAERLSSELENHQMTQADLAAKLGVKPAYISRVLRGQENLTLQSLAKIAFAFDKKWECMLVAQEAHVGLYTMDYGTPVTRCVMTTTTIPANRTPESDNNFADYTLEKIA
jgi:transcriptional regulator with XRE-family HTH domain